jgi:hypothetical protein
VDKYNYASVISCSEQNAIDRDTLKISQAPADMTQDSNMTTPTPCPPGMVYGNITTALPSCTPVRSGNLTTGGNMTTKLLPYQIPAIGYQCPPGSFDPINATTSRPTCDRPVNTTETLASSSNTSIASTCAQCQNSYYHNQSTTTIDCLNMLGENIRGALAAG